MPRARRRNQADSQSWPRRAARWFPAPGRGARPAAPARRVVAVGAGPEFERAQREAALVEGEAVEVVAGAGAKIEQLSEVGGAFEGVARPATGKLPSPDQLNSRGIDIFLAATQFVGRPAVSAACATVKTACNVRHDFISLEEATRTWPPDCLPHRPHTASSRSASGSSTDETPRGRPRPGARPSASPRIT